MTEAADYDFEKLAREITSARLRGLEKAPAAAGEIAAKIIIAGVQSTKARQDPRLSVISVCRGVLGGMLLIEGDLPAASVEILQQMAHLAQELHLDPADMMTWAMEGFASVVVLGHSDLGPRLRDAIEHKFMGAGGVFDELCQKAARGG